MKVSSFSKYIMLAAAVSAFAPMQARADVFVNLLGRQTVSRSYYQQINLTNIYVDNAPVAEALDRINKTLQENSPERELPVAERDRLRKVYQLDTYGKMIGLNIDGASATALVKKIGRPTFEQVIEDRLKNLQINAILAGNVARAMRDEGAFRDAGAMRDAADVNSAPFEPTALHFLLSWGRQNARLPYVQPDKEDLQETRILAESAGKDLSFDEKRALVAFFSLASAEVVREGADFRRVTFENISERPGDLLATSQAWHNKFRSLLTGNWDQLDRQVMYCKEQMGSEAKKVMGEYQLSQKELDDSSDPAKTYADTFQSWKNYNVKNRPHPVFPDLASPAGYVRAGMEVQYSGSHRYYVTRRDFKSDFILGMMDYGFRMERSACGQAQLASRGRELMKELMARAAAKPVGADTGDQIQALQRQIDELRAKQEAAKKAN